MAPLSQSKRATTARVQRLWKSTASKIEKLNQLGCHGGVMVRIKGKVLAAGSLGPSMLQHRQTISAAENLPLASPVFSPLPGKLEDMTERTLRRWVANYVRTSLGRRQPRWGDKENAPVWWPHDVLPYKNVSTDSRTDKTARSFRQCLQLCLQACCEHHGIRTDTGCSKAQQSRLQTVGTEMATCASRISAATRELLKIGDLLRFKEVNVAGSDIFTELGQLMRLASDLQTSYAGPSAPEALEPVLERIEQVGLQVELNGDAHAGGPELDIDASIMDDN
ncbi:uncharacterized protein LOC135824357 isoform X2 [Sycon ciliatum]|uniref:uncharacterized protein LOC135824357 isoform X2 n=1 Tax=Sycon ciliatum TaxID=27933 RepID=UPI0031F6BB76